MRDYYIIIIISIIERNSQPFQHIEKQFIYLCLVNDLVDGEFLNFERIFMASLVINFRVEAAIEQGTRNSLFHFKFSFVG